MVRGERYTGVGSLQRLCYVVGAHGVGVLESSLGIVFGIAIALTLRAETPFKDRGQSVDLYNTCDAHTCN